MCNHSNYTTIELTKNSTTTLDILDTELLPSTCFYISKMVIQGLDQTYSLSIVLECKMIQSTNRRYWTGVPASRVGPTVVLLSSNASYLFTETRNDTGTRLERDLNKI